MTERIHIGVIGCGNIAITGHIPAVLAHQRFLLRALCDVRPEKVEAALQLYRQLSPGGEPPLAHLDYRALIDAGELDACIVALQPEHSVEVVQALLQNGIAVLDEKPLAANLEDGLRLVDAVRRTGGAYQIGFCTRYCKLVRNLAGWVATLGIPRLYQVSIFDESLARCQGEYGAMIEGILRHSSAMIHEGSHCVDWMSLMHDSPMRAVKASALTTEGWFPGPNLWDATFDFEDGSSMQLTVGWLLRNQPPSTLRVLGPGGWLEMDLFEGRGQLAAGDLIEELHTDGLRQAWAEQLDAFAQAIDRGHAEVATIHDGLRALRATIACELSVAECRAIELRGDLSFL